MIGLQVQNEYEILSYQASEVHLVIDVELVLW
jgi:hypothetical protein